MPRFLSLALARGLLAGCLLLAACGDRRPPAQRVVPAWPTGPQCLAALAARGVPVEPWRAAGGGRCGVDTPVEITAAGRVALRPPLRTSCSMALAWAAFVAEADRLARRELGAGLALVRHLGSHACRAMTGNGARLSLHASARALDVQAFVLTDGRTVSVADDWDAWGAEGRFLEGVARAACAHFSATLTPETDRHHADHLHLDIGPWKLCGL